ncbi:hypothetical protein GCM10020331_074140 [Ectobacillus funiculus]
MKEQKILFLELNQMNYKGDADLVADFKDIRELAEHLKTNEDKGDLRKLHRYFHDLDVVMNNADGDGAFLWNNGMGRRQRLKDGKKSVPFRFFDFMKRNDLCPCL